MNMECLSVNFQFSSVTQSCPIPCDPMNHSTPGLPVHHQLPEFTQTHVHWVGDAIQPSHPLLPPSPPALNPSQHWSLFQWVNSSHEVAKVLDFQLQHQSFQWTPGLISFRMDWLDLLAIQRTLKSLLQHHSSEASILQCSAFFISNIHWITEKAREFQTNIYFCFIDYAKAFDCVDHNKLENSRDGNTRPPDLPSEKAVGRSRSNS